jgi:DNA-binding IclR family transcriptional regulator
MKTVLVSLRVRTQLALVAGALSLMMLAAAPRRLQRQE